MPRPLVLVAVLVTGCAEPDPVDVLEPPPDSTPTIPGPPADSLFGVWEPAPPMPGPRMRHAAVVHEGALVVVGGVVGPGTITASAIRLRPGAGEWEELAPLPLKLAGLSLVVVLETLFAVGGDGPAFLRPEQALFAYDPSGDVWMSRTNVPDRRTDAEAVAVDGRLWLTGGPVEGPGVHGPRISGDTILVYTPGSDAWAYGGALPTPRRDHEAVQEPTGLTYLVGGEHGDWSDIFPDVEAYDPSTATWRSVADPYPTHRIAAAFADPYVHVVGGDDYRDFHRALDTRDDRWVGLPSLPHPLEWPQLVHWDGALWLIGGLRTTEDGGRDISSQVHRMSLDAVTPAR